MNQEDRAAEPMFNAFTNTPNLTPYTFLKNQIPLTYGLTPSKPAKGALVPTLPARLGVPASVRGIYQQWVVWSQRGRFNGNGAMQDWANPAQLNRLDWYSAHGWKVPYPGDKKILPPGEVPGHNLPNGYLGD